MTTPHTMRAVRLVDASGRLAVSTVGVPVPAPNQVLVRVRAAAVHPIDLRFVRDASVRRRPVPAIPGVEAAGVVVETGGGLVSRFLQGRRVNVGPGALLDGTWAEYVLADDVHCLPLWRGLSDEQGALLREQPLRAVALVARCVQAGHRGLAQTGAHTAVGRLVWRRAKARGVEMVNVVPTPEAAKRLAARGARVVLDQSDPGFAAKFRREVGARGVTCLIDGQGGQATAQLAQALPVGAEVLLYGADLQPSVSLDTAAIVRRGLQVRGFSLEAWLRTRGVRGLVGLSPQIRSLLAAETAPGVAQRVRLDNLPDVLADGLPEDGRLLMVP